MFTPTGDAIRKCSDVAFPVRIFEQGQGCLVAAGPEVRDHDPDLGVPDVLMDEEQQHMGGPCEQHWVRGGHRQGPADGGVSSGLKCEVPANAVRTLAWRPCSASQAEAGWS